MNNKRPGEWRAIPPAKFFSIICKGCGFFMRMAEHHKSVLTRLNPLNVEARYPEYKEQIASSLTIAKCKEIISETEALLHWIKDQL